MKEQRRRTWVISGTLGVLFLGGIVAASGPIARWQRAARQAAADKNMLDHQQAEFEAAEATPERKRLRERLRLSEEMSKQSAELAGFIEMADEAKKRGDTLMQMKRLNQAMDATNRVSAIQEQIDRFDARQVGEKKNAK